MIVFDKRVRENTSLFGKNSKIRPVIDNEDIVDIIKTELDYKENDFCLLATLKKQKKGAVFKAEEVKQEIVNFMENFNFVNGKKEKRDFFKFMSTANITTETIRVLERIQSVEKSYFIAHCIINVENCTEIKTSGYDVNFMDIRPFNFSEDRYPHPWSNHFYLELIEDFRSTFSYTLSYLQDTINRDKKKYSAISDKKKKNVEELPIEQYWSTYEWRGETDFEGNWYQGFKLFYTTEKELHDILENDEKLPYKKQKRNTYKIPDNMFLKYDIDEFRRTCLSLL